MISSLRVKFPSRKSDTKRKGCRVKTLNTVGLFMSVVWFTFKAVIKLFLDATG